MPDTPDILPGSWSDESSQLAHILGALIISDKGGSALVSDDAFARWVELTLVLRERRHTCYFVGNGASASMASHFAADLAKNGKTHTQVFTDPSLLTAISNDINYEQVFAEPILRAGKRGDMLVAISSSGRSPNILAAVAAARERHMTVVTLSAMNKNNPLRDAGDLNAWIAADSYGKAETGHAAILHHWMDRVTASTGDDTTPLLAFDRSRLAVKPLGERTHDLSLSAIVDITPTKSVDPALTKTAEAMIRARKEGAGVVMMMGGHVIRAGVQKYIIDLMERGLVTALAFNGAGLIHDYEFALIGATTESVAHYLRQGQFGLWEETGHLNDIVNAAAPLAKGLGAAVGAHIDGGPFPYKDISLFAAAHRLGVPATVHVGIGYDIVFEHPNCDGAAWGATSYSDFLKLVTVMQKIEGGVVMNFGSAVMAPEVFLKALSMARNVAHQSGQSITRFSTLVADLRPPPKRFDAEPQKGSSDYYFRPFKTMLVRSVSDGGNSYYAQGDHAITIPQLWTAAKTALGEEKNGA